MIEHGNALSRRLPLPRRMFISGQGLTAAGRTRWPVQAPSSTRRLQVPESQQNGAHQPTRRRLSLLVFLSARAKTRVTEGAGNLLHYQYLISLGR